MTAPSSSRPVLLALWLGALAAAAVALVGSPPGAPLIDAGFIAHVAGMLAGYSSTVMVGLMSRWPVIERRVGSDVLARWHAFGGRLFVALVLVHAGAAVAAWATTRGQDPVTATVNVLGLPGLLEATVGTALFVAVVGVSLWIARRRISYEAWHLVHLLTYGAIALSFVHELAGPNLAGRPLLQVAWTLLHAWAFALVLRYRVLGPLEIVWRHRLRVQAVVPEAHGVVSVIMRGRHVDELGIQAGQFFRWRFLTPATWASAHPFSLSAVPQGDLLRITVKALGNGSRLIHAVSPGTLVLAEGPSGALTAARRTRRSVLLIAGGVGITPMRALFESLDARGGRVTLLYRASRPEDVVFRHELEQIARHRGAEILWLVGPSSRPDLQMTGDTLRRLVPDVAGRDVYLCASPGLSAAVRSGLRAAGLPRRHLHEEVFAF
ncbi:ferric reductase-like transmembrane domain-containing protein [Actinomycetospora sp. TBRC 11914]|uniref:ferredoxin reductase family protein n=1 Tax=Actinomycetospora sp. TBRC 11914 TaxID=2729387 RepID=UPI00145F017E|nr:ferredoxin reductase family protein [Actinomycetospora sp. TBRC 11914]NMO89345.1 ferredoxin reductase family protein [Actinomycetospora sp. TBRC 11914]